MLHFIINRKSKSGNGKKVWLQVKEYLKENNIPYETHVTESQGHAKRIATELSMLPDEEVRVVVIGGDGTINETINGIQNFYKIRFGVIPSGSGNDFARGLGLKGTPKDHIQRIVECKEPQIIDLGRVTRKEDKRQISGKNQNADTNPNGNKNQKDVLNKNGDMKREKISRLFVISSGIGMDAIVTKKTDESRLKKILNKVGLGKLTYLLITVQTLFSMETFTLKASFDGEEKEWKKTIFMAAMNCSAEGGGVKMAPKSSFSDGKLSFCCIHGIPKGLCFLLLPILAIGKHEGIKGIELIDCENCEIHSDVPVVLHTDGEYCGEAKDLQFECEVAKLHMMM